MQLGVRDVSKLLNVSEKTIYRWIAQGVLPAYRVNEQYRFNRAELLEWATSRKMNVAAGMFDEPESSTVPIPGLAEALQAGGVFYRLSGADKESVLRAVVEHMRLPEEVDREVKDRIFTAGQNGGYIITRANSLTDYCKTENVWAMAEAIKKYGTYPLPPI